MNISQLIEKSKQTQEAVERLAKRYLDLDAEQMMLNKKLKKLNAEIEKKLRDEEEDLVITDHAFVRYLERFCEYPIEELKKQLAEKVRPLLGKQIDGVYTLEGLQFRIINRTVVTITK